MPSAPRAEDRKPLDVAAEVLATPREVTWEIVSERINDIVTLADPSSVMFYVSPGCRALGYSQQDLIGGSPQDLVHPDDLAQFMANTAAVLDTGTPVSAERREYRVRCKDGSWVWLQGSPSLIRNADGETIGFINVFRDVTERRALEDQLRVALAEAEKLAAVKSEFLANMSHEIRTPLTAVLGFTSLLAERTDLAPEAQTYVERVAAAGRSLLAIVNDVLDYSKLEAGRVKLAPSAIDIAGLAAEAVELFEGEAASKGLRLTFDARSAPAAVLLDPDRVRQVLVNLIGNAVKFTEAGGITVTLDYDVEAERLAIAVADTGPGIPAAVQEKLFQRFTQADSSPTRAKGGTGLGLAISRRLAEAMGGEVTLASRVGRGSIFRLELPAPVAEAALVAGDEADAGLAVLDGLRVLVCDDNPVNRELAQAILEPMGVEVSEACDGLGAVELAARLPVDLILMDLRMPGLDGAQAAQAIRREPGPNREIPILAFSADSEANAAGEALGPFNGRVAKPVAPLALLQAIAEAIWTPDEPLLMEAADAG